MFSTNPVFLGFSSYQNDKQLLQIRIYIKAPECIHGAFTFLDTDPTLTAFSSVRGVKKTLIW